MILYHYLILQVRPVAAYHKVLELSLEHAIRVTHWLVGTLWCHFLIPKV